MKRDIYYYVQRWDGAGPGRSWLRTKLEPGGMGPGSVSALDWYCHIGLLFNGMVPFTSKGKNLIIGLKRLSRI